MVMETEMVITGAIGAHRRSNELLLASEQAPGPGLCGIGHISVPRQQHVESASSSDPCHQAAVLSAQKYGTIYWISRSEAMGSF
ncbi:hypothetical protein B0H67DRAFT_573076 [Lasiosphaeris hirsuta]|uniref:Uncharacterized protein n=1 Tax=Lasiosphaeris hirsuta TaxID=260670 RepID=A0AA40AP69_9PEZI|nr:hypothetical protein B0H67DRAFT_573076 [Lasiosphaeris hirsuta]